PGWRTPKAAWPPPGRAATPPTPGSQNWRPAGHRPSWTTSSPSTRRGWRPGPRPTPGRPAPKPTPPAPRPTPAALSPTPAAPRLRNPQPPPAISTEWWFGSQTPPAPPVTAPAAPPPPVRALAERLSAEGRAALARIEAQL